MFAAAASANAATVYNDIPPATPVNGNVVSQAFQATQAAEFGGQVGLAGTQRQDPTITVLMSSWGCGTSGTWNGGDCVTTAGATFSHPITLNLYSVLPNTGEPGGLIASVTQTFNVPFRPSANPACTGGNAGKWTPNGGTNCFNGFATPITFNLTGRGISLPDHVIVSVAFNTTNWGYQPIGTQPCDSTSNGCGYDSLNVGVANNGSPIPPTAGTQPRPDDAYYNSATAGQYCSPSGPANVFRLDAGCWTGLQPAFQVDATTTGGPAGPAGPAGPTGPTGATGVAGPSGSVAGAVAGSTKKCKKVKKAAAKAKKCKKK
jgi:hypothetical protein